MEKLALVEANKSLIIKDHEEIKKIISASGYKACFKCGKINCLLYQKLTLKKLGKRQGQGNCKYY